MAYLKLDKEIVTSSLWIDSDVALLFITALLLARLREFSEPMPQLRVDALEETGYVVPPGRYGYLSVAGSGLIRAAAMPQDRGMVALKALGEPDQDSRSQEHAGRRLVRINGGYIILNFERWQGKDHGTAERQRRFRERKVGNGSAEFDRQAEEVLTACLISDKRLIVAVARAIETHMKANPDWTPERTAARMIEGYKAYGQANANGNLRYTIPPRKFFSQGYWLTSEHWPLEKERRRR
jgi:hypothetical protein